MGAEKIVRVVIDTNVVVSALLFGGPPGKLAQLWESGRVQPVASPVIIDEYVRVLAYPRFQLRESEIEYLLYRRILPHFEIVMPESGPPAIIGDPADDAFLYCAAAAGAAAIISGDRHLLALGTFQGIPIVAPASFKAPVRK